MACLRESEEDNLKDGELHKHEKQFAHSGHLLGRAGQGGAGFHLFFHYRLQKKKVV